jgi:hypothetical protein
LTPRRAEAVVRVVGIGVESDAVPPEVPMSKKRRKLRGTVQKVIKPAFPNQPEKAQINVEGADDLYREIRVENVVKDEKGEESRLKAGAEVDVIVEADSSATIKKTEKP